ncbi:hypothetical protein BKA61DRAFT_616627 [Leptodontidium sp. MPI-SDFR-AT-0119]|nr:hypothetical protein BKA61DRAFT_616627 [Leptodontidium sp. MPI-SDFR-AT-0119]
MISSPSLFLQSHCSNFFPLYFDSRSLRTAKLTYLCEMAALPESSCTSNISDEAGPQTFDSFSSTIRESRTSGSIDSIDVEKGDVSVSTAEAASSSFHSLCWLRFSTAVVSWTLYPTEWYKVNRQLAEEEKKRLQLLYSDIKSGRPAIEDYPEGWPQLAAFLHSEDNFAIFRRFGVLHCRLLVQLQAEIQHLEQRLVDLDRSDAAPGSQHSWRLQMSDFKEGSDPAQRDLLKTLQEKVLVYDQLLLNEKALRDQGTVTEKDHRSVFHWMLRKRPVVQGEDGWIHHPTDCIPLSRIDPVEHSILTSFLKKLFRSKGKERDSIVKQYSLSSVTIAVKLCFILLAVSILIIPVFILMWGPDTKTAVSTTVLISVMAFSTLMTLFTRATVQAVLIGTAAYCAVLATFLGNTHDRTAAITG